MQDQELLNIRDGEDVRRALAGDQAAFAALYERYFNRVYDFLARMLRDPAAAEDVTQETFIQAMTNLPRLKKPEGFKSWLFTIARNGALNRLERGKRVVAMPTMVTDEGEEMTLDLVDDNRQSDPSLPVLDQELASLVWEAARGLDEKSYSILDLHVRQGLDSGEIAEALGVTKGNAYTMLSRVKDRFEEALAVLLVSRRGQQDCSVLQVMLLDTPQFTAEVRDRVGKHIKTCEACSATRRKVVVPFNVISGLAAPLPPAGLKERVWDDLMTRWPPGSVPSGIGGDPTRMHGWWQTVRRRWPISVAALLLLTLGILTSFVMVRGDSAPAPTMTPIPPTATVVPPTPTIVRPTLTPVPPTLVPTLPPTIAPLVIPPTETPTPVPATDTPTPPTDTPVPPTEAPTRPPMPTKLPPTPVRTPPPIPPTLVPPPVETPVPDTAPTSVLPTSMPVLPTAVPTTIPTPSPTPVPPGPTFIPFPPTPTHTPVPPTATFTPVVPTATFTPVVPTATFTPVVPTATFTPVPPPLPPAKLAAAPPRVRAGTAFTITNTGGQPLIWSASVTGGYKLSSSGGTVAPGQSVSVTVTAPPAGVAAPPVGVISISSNGGSATLSAFAG